MQNSHPRVLIALEIISIYQSVVSENDVEIHSGNNSDARETRKVRVGLICLLAMTGRCLFIHIRKIIADNAVFFPRKIA